MNDVIDVPKIKLTSFSHGGGCGCKIAPALLSEILKDSVRVPVPKELLVGIATSDDAAFPVTFGDFVRMYEPVSA